MKSRILKRIIASTLCLLLAFSLMTGNAITTSAKASSVTAKVTSGSSSGSFKLSSNDNLLAKSSSSYNHNLANFMCGVSTLMYNDSIKEAKRVLKKVGYSNFKYSKDAKGDSVTYLISSKTVKIKKVKYDVLLVSIRGTESNEWEDNFNSGYQKTTHEGFSNAADKLYSAVASYSKKYNLKKKKTKILITGHSRGAAVANLLAKKVDDNGVGQIKASKKNTFAYTFATPNTTSDENRAASSYNNIFNIINKDDFIAKLLPESWGYGRYGITYVLPENETSAFKKAYKKMSGDDYSFDQTSVDAIDQYFSDLTAFVTSNDEYYNKSLVTAELTENEGKSLKNLYSKAFSMAMSGNTSLTFMLEISSGKWGEVGTNTVSLFSDKAVLSSVMTTHGPATYLAKLQSYSKSDLSVKS
ncbi:MAG: DUF2974 domain-containing protein [Lachnospiraceae bacterium]|nr:DUF2974 domain-containing protein [Lachnospiraceae bacterium]